MLVGQRGETLAHSMELLSFAQDRTWRLEYAALQISQENVFRQADLIQGKEEGS